MKDLENLKFMSIGGNCAPINLLGEYRIKGPVDNIAFSKGLNSVASLFNGDMLDYIQNYIPQEIPRRPSFENDSTICYSYPTFYVVHNNPLEDKYKSEFNRRFNVFLDFYKCIDDPRYYFVYSLNDQDITESFTPSNNFMEGLSFLKSINLIDKVIFIGTKCTNAFWNFNISNIDNLNINYIEINNFNMRKAKYTVPLFKNALENLSIKRNIKNIKFMSIGGNCAPISFLGSQRIRGPIDNIKLTYGLSDIKILFNNEILSVLKDKPNITDKEPGFLGDSNKEYNYGRLIVLHNDPTKEEFLKEISKRIGNFKAFYKKVKEDDSYYFVYSLNAYDITRERKCHPRFFQGIQFLSNLGILDKVIFVAADNRKTFWNYRMSDVGMFNIKYLTLPDFNMEEKDYYNFYFLKKLVDDNIIPYTYFEESKKFPEMMSLGGNCRNIALLGPTRVSGPIDNIELNNGLVGTNILFKNKLLDIINTETPIQSKRSPSFLGDSETLYTYKEFSIVHNNPLEERYKRNIKSRMLQFNRFYRDLLTSTNKYFVYAMSIGDINMSDYSLTKNFIAGLEYLEALGILNKTIIVGTKCATSKYSAYIEDENIKAKIPFYIQIDDFSFKNKNSKNIFYKKLVDLNIL